MNKVWTMSLSPYFSILLLTLLTFCVCPPSPSQVVSNCIFCEPSNDVYIYNFNKSTSKCVSDSNFSRDGDRRDLNAVLSSYIARDKDGKPFLPGISGLFSRWRLRPTLPGQSNKKNMRLATLA